MDSKDDVDGLKEKYFHSMAAALTDEGDLEEAVVFFQKAIDIRQTPYGWYGFSMALQKAGDLAGAVGALTRAIKLAPGTPEYYRERSIILESMGRTDLADEDKKRAISLDRNSERVDTIIEASRIVGEAFFKSVIPEDVEKSEAGDEWSTAAICAFGQEKKQMEDALRKPSCPVRVCPAYCCYFTGKLLKHGVTVGPWKLNALREHFRRNGLLEEEYLETFFLTGEEYAESLFPPQDIMKKGDAEFVVFPRQGRQPLGMEMARSIPKARGYTTLMWVDDGARPCAFLTDRRCSIYDVGGEPALEPCSSFLCMTGFVFVVLGYLGIVNESMLEGMTIVELNGIAIEALIVLAQDVYGNEEVKASRQEALEEFKAALETWRQIGADGPGRGEAPRCPAKERYDDTMEKHIAAAREKIARLFQNVGT